MNRRYFLGSTLATGAALGVRSAESFAQDASNRIVVGVMGTGGRGTSLATAYAAIPGVTVGYVCDVDATRARRAAEAVGRAAPEGTRAPQVVPDFRRILDDRAVDVFICAACNHWHAPASILACDAGKHVYVEKPCSHTPREGELFVAAARRNNRKVQMGNQRRSWPKVIEAIEAVRSGAIGRAYLAQSWYVNARPTIGRGMEGNPPEGLDFDLWQGPCTRRPFRSNYLHYNWHWFWHWGNGELGNNGVHMIDVCRWGLGVDYPIRVTSSGGRYRYEDDQETPDTHVVSFDYPGRKSIVWEGLSCNRRPTGTTPDVLFFGEEGSLSISGGGYVVYDNAGRETRRVAGQSSDTLHFQNFLNACRGNGTLNSEIEEAHKSTLPCHLGNIAYRQGKTLHCEATNGHIRNDADSMRMWTKDYAPGWAPRER